MKTKSRSEEFHFGDSLMLLPYPCLAPHHALSSTPSFHVWNPTCIRYTTTCIGYTITCIWYTTTCLVPHHPCLVSHNITGTHPCLEPHHVSNPIPCPFWYPTQVPHCHHLAHSTPPLSGHCCSYLASNCPLPLIWHLPSHCLELLLHATPTTPSNCHLALMHPAIPSLLATAPAPSGSLSSASCPTTLLPH